MKRDGDIERECRRRRNERRSAGKRRHIERLERMRRKRERRERKRRRRVDRRRERSASREHGNGARIACAQKKYYYTEAGAMRAVRYMESVFHTRFTAYKCSYCSGWHLTTHGFGGKNEVERDPRELEIQRM